MLTKSQRQAVIELQRQRKRQRNTNSGSSDNNNNNQAYSAEISSLRDDLASLTDAIVSGVSQANIEDLSVITDIQTVQNDPSTSQANSNKRKALSGAVGDFIRKQRKGPT